jgi:hypothetical protein
MTNMDDLNILTKIKQAQDELDKLLKRPVRIPFKCRNDYNEVGCCALMHEQALNGACIAFKYLMGEYTEEEWRKFLFNVSKPLPPEVAREVIEGFFKIYEKEEEARKYLKLDD